MEVMVVLEVENGCLKSGTLQERNVVDLIPNAYRCVSYYLKHVDNICNVCLLVKTNGFCPARSCTIEDVYSSR
ncbi:unnamed protein product [Lactuca virosa]|uniref:Uncharacterized protein n=1 Tax=Lactuca virosa TaxID=75947 RepID=A0AAU9N490_9ASTR|nr:unnamed protein product [Lactuca virosa]